MTQYDPAGTVEMKPPEILTSLSTVVVYSLYTESL